MSNDTPDQRRSGPPRREPSRFEPPPWEKEQFDQLSRERQEREEAERLAAEAARAAETAAAPSSPPDESRPAAAALGIAAGAAVATPSPVGAEESVVDEDVPVDSAKVEEMFQELSAEEGDGLGVAAERLRLGVGIALLVLGIGLALVSMRLLASSFQTGGPAVLVGSSIMGFMGVALAGAGLYLAVRSLRERGVM